jgi:hypothetical protein
MTVPDRVPPGTPTVVLLQALATFDVGAADRAAASV